MGGGVTIVGRVVTGSDRTGLAKPWHPWHGSRLGAIRRHRQREQPPWVAHCDEMSIDCTGRHGRKKAADASLWDS